MTQKLGSHGGKREDLDNRYFRSSMEANYARYLNLLVKGTAILKWEFEPDEFWFDGIKRGIRAYRPDFKIWRLDGTIYYCETKGFWAPEDLTRKKRMEKYHPHVEVDYVDYTRYKTIERQVAHMIPHWERGSNGRARANSGDGETGSGIALPDAIANDPARMARVTVNGKSLTEEAIDAIRNMGLPRTPVAEKQKTRRMAPRRKI